MNKLKLKMAAKRTPAPVNMDPVVLGIREKVLAMLANEPMGAAISAINYLLSQPADMETRMALLSARIKILRRRTEASRRHETPNKMEAVNHVPEPNDMRALPDSLKIDLNALKPKEVGRVFLKILEDSDVNGLHLPKGFKIEVEPEEAEKLIAANRAERIEAEKTAKTEQSDA